MIKYDLLKTANQKFNTNIGENNFEFDFHTFRGIIYINVRLNGDLACVNTVARQNVSLFNGIVNRAARGVFMFKSLVEDYPSFEQFDGVTCNFVFIPDEEL